jgi:hypothetical protein
MMCPKCEHEDAKRTEWKPEKGLEPNLHQYKCFNTACGYQWYDVRRSSRHQPNGADYMPPRKS